MFKRVFVIVFDSLGIGNAKDADKFNDVGSDTLKSVLESGDAKELATLSELGFLNLCSDKKYHANDYKGIICKLNEASAGKDTLTGHYEMMGLLVTKPSVTFTDTGFPPELIAELETKWGRKIIGNKSASGTEIIKELGVYDKLYVPWKLGNEEFKVQYEIHVFDTRLIKHVDGKLGLDGEFNDNTKIALIDKETLLSEVVEFKSFKINLE